MRFEANMSISVVGSQVHFVDCVFQACGKEGASMGWREAGILGGGGKRSIAAARRKAGDREAG